MASKWTDLCTIGLKPPTGNRITQDSVLNAKSRLKWNLSSSPEKSAIGRSVDALEDSRSGLQRR